MEIFIKGNYKRSIYENSNGYHIGLFRVSDTNCEKYSDYIGKTITFTGYFHELNDIDTYLFYGKMVNHPKYGEQFNVDSYERCKPDEKNSIIEFLTSGLFKGIGEKKAKKIVEVLGKDTLNVILENPSNLILIPTITKKNIETLHNKLKEYEASYEAIIYLNEIGFSTKEAMIIYNHYKENTRSIIDEDIYSLIKNIVELNFKKIDKIALSIGVKKDDLIRIKSAIIYIMEEVSNMYGHSYFYKEEIKNTLPKILSVNISDDQVDSALSSLEMDMDIIISEDRYYLKEMYEAENLIVKRTRLLAYKDLDKKKDLDKMIVELENYFDIEYNIDQQEAIKQSSYKNFLIITGGPGTGKTTIMKGITELYRKMYKLSYEKLSEKIALLAPTGRAAKRMSETTLLNASTIHRFLKWQKETNKFQVNEYNKSKVELVIIDEASMIDTYLLANLFKGISSNCRVIMVGDYYQLPSVGPGQVLHDLITSNKLPVVELKELYRQGIDSNILSLAYDVRSGVINKNVFNKEDDLTFIEAKDNEVINNIIEISRTYKDLNYKKFQILAPMYKTINGIDSINNAIQDIFNKKDKTKKEILIGETIFRESDKVIQLTNMPDENVYNGDIGIISRIILHPKKEVYIDFDYGTVKYTPANFNKFRLAYAISIHKAQGSEFDVVIMPIVKQFNKMLYRKLVYTGITRSKKKLYIVGDVNALKKAVDNTDSDVRRTTIKEFLINGIK